MDNEGGVFQAMAAPLFWLAKMAICASPRALVTAGSIADVTCRLFISVIVFVYLFIFEKSKSTQTRPKTLIKQNTNANEHQQTPIITEQQRLPQMHKRHLLSFGLRLGLPSLLLAVSWLLLFYGIMLKKGGLQPLLEL